jgi:hypothetical protein
MAKIIIELGDTLLQQQQHGTGISIQGACEPQQVSVLATLDDGGDVVLNGVHRRADLSEKGC